MKKSLAAASLAAMIVALTLSGCSQSTVTTAYEDDIAGNTPFNIMCGGRLAEQDGNVYYYEPASVWNYGGGLFSSAIDGTGKARLARGVVESINSLGGEIYFVRLQSGSSLGALCRVSSEGKGEEKVAEGCREALVIGKTAYYIGAGDRLFSLDTGGGQPAELVSQPVLDYSVDGDFIYYRLADSVYRTVAAGTPVRLMEGPVDAFSEWGTLVYCSVYDSASGSNTVTVLNPSDGSTSKFEYKGAKITRLSPYLNSMFLYTADDELIRVNPDGTGPVLYGRGRAADPCFFADKAFVWTKEKPLALLDSSGVGFDTVDVYAAADTVTDSVALKIDSAEALAVAMDTYGLDSASGDTLADKYGDDYFAKKALILVLARVQSGSAWTVTGLSFSGVRTIKADSLTLDVAMDAAVASDTDEADCGGCLIEVAKSDLNYTDNVEIVVNDIGDVSVG